MRIAAIDIGGDSIHIVTAHVESEGRRRGLDRAKETIRLGRILLDTIQLELRCHVSAFHSGQSRPIRRSRPARRGRGNHR